MPAPAVHQEMQLRGQGNWCSNSAWGCHFCPPYQMQMVKLQGQGEKLCSDTSICSVQTEQSSPASEYFFAGAISDLPPAVHGGGQGQQKQAAVSYPRESQGCNCVRSMTAVQPRQRDAFMLTPSLTDTRLMQPQAMSHQELSQQEVRRQHSIAEATQAHQPVMPCSLQRFRRPLPCLTRTTVADWGIVSSRSAGSYATLTHQCLPRQGCF